MRIVVEKLSKDGQRVTFRKNTAWAEEAARSGLEGPVTELTGDLLIEPRGSGAHVSGVCHAETIRACERCGEEAPLMVDADVSFYYAPAVRMESRELELDTKELDLGWFENGELDLKNVVCEALALAMPPRIACSDVSTCDARTKALLDARGSSGDTGSSVFAQLKNLHES